MARRWAAVGLVVYGMVLAAFLLGTDTLASELITSVTAKTHQLGLSPSYATTSRVEFALNVIALMPVSALGALIWPRSNWRDWTAAGFVISFSVELAQIAVVAGRSATFVDVVANTAGAALGAVAVTAVRRPPQLSLGSCDGPQ